MAGKHGVLTWFPQKAVSNIRDRLAAATERASAEGADRARENAPLGKGEHAPTGANPRFFAIRLQTTHEFNRATKRGKFTRRQQEHRAAQLVRLKELRSLTRGELTQAVKPSDVEFFRFHDRLHRDEATGVTYRTKGEQPHELDVRPGRGPGGERVVGARNHYTPGTLKKGIRVIDVAISGKTVRGGFASEAPYSNVVEHGFHHKGGTQIEGKHFMKRATEDLRADWNRGTYLKE